ncbi:MAG: hypothetical protein ACYTGH_08905 [Planctomycetota bacterium]|jgi:hypothetical protein
MTSISPDSQQTIDVVACTDAACLKPVAAMLSSVSETLHPQWSARIHLITDLRETEGQVDVVRAQLRSGHSLNWVSVRDHPMRERFSGFQ